MWGYIRNLRHHRESLFLLMHDATATAVALGLWLDSNNGWFDSNNGWLDSNNGWLDSNNGWLDSNSGWPNTAGADSGVQQTGSCVNRRLTWLDWMLEWHAWIKHCIGLRRSQVCLCCLRSSQMRQQTRFGFSQNWTHDLSPGKTKDKNLTEVMTVMQ